eukprot:Hpha_TRINITY_DN16936_c0_g1::TRINITY_DN16936_c0_g1_i4::g.56648::m.56648/K10392/KIF1; kinesin family member 1
MSEGESVQVAVRMRPFNQREKDADSFLVVRMANETKGSRTWIRKNKDAAERMYEFDYSFQTHGKDVPGIGPYADQNTVFDTLGKPVLDSALEGKNVCLFAYGQTGAGKSFSMLGKEHCSDPDLQGIIPRSCNEIFRRRDLEKDNPLVEYLVTIQVVEIYCEMVNDLLAPKSTWPKHGHKPRFLGAGQGYTVDTVKVPCTDYRDIEKAFDMSNKNRSVGSHALNGASSRAHTIYMITYKRTEKASADATTATTVTSMINLVDLAGSERTSLAETTGQMLKEGNAINLSLTALGNCIKVLSEAKPGKKVPFRDSKLTLLLEGAMTNGRVIMIAALSPANICYDESVSTLEFAKRIKSVKIMAKKNITTDPLEELAKAKDAMEKEMNAEIERLKSILAGQGKTDAFLQGVEDAGAERKKLEEERAKLAEELEEERKAAQHMRAELERLMQAEKERAKMTPAERQELQRKAAQHMRAELERLMQAEKERAKMTPAERQELQRKETARIFSAVDKEIEGDRGGPGKGPFLSNLNEDPRLSGAITYSLKPGENVIGKKGGKATIPLFGDGIVDNHATIVYDDSEGSMQIILSKVAPGARVLVNGEPQKDTDIAKEPRTLLHNSRLWIGSSANVFVMQTPGYEDDCEKDVETDGDGVTFAFARNEAEKLDKMFKERERAVASGDLSKADSLRKTMASFHKTPGALKGPNIEDLEKQKQEAIAREDYEEASRISRLLTAAAPSVIELEQRKRYAIANEDFEEASRLSELIKARQTGSWRAPNRLQGGGGRGAWGDGTGGAGSPRDQQLPPMTSRDYQSAQEIGGDALVSARPGDQVIPMTARTQAAFRQRMMFTGRASVSLSFLVDSSGSPSKFQTLALEVPADVPLTGSLPPQLAVNIYQMTPQGQPQKRFAIGERADFVVHVIGAKGIPEMFSHTVFCKYIFKWGERDSYKTPELKNTTEPNFDFKKRFAFPKMTPTLMDWFKQDQVLTFELIGIGQMS